MPKPKAPRPRTARQRSAADVEFTKAMFAKAGRKKHKIPFSPKAGTSLKDFVDSWCAMGHERSRISHASVW